MMWTIAGVGVGCAALFTRDARTFTFVALTAAAAAYALRVRAMGVPPTAAVDMFGVSALRSRLVADPQVSVSDERAMRRGLEAAVDSYLRALTPTPQRGASLHAADYDAHRTLVLRTAEPLPEYVGVACRTIFDRLDSVLVWKRLMHTRSAGVYASDSEDAWTASLALFTVDR